MRQRVPGRVGRRSDVPERRARVRLVPEGDTEPPTNRERARLDDSGAVLDLGGPLQPELIAPCGGAVWLAPTDRCVQQEARPTRRALVNEVQPGAARQIHADRKSTRLN